MASRTWDTCLEAGVSGIARRSDVFAPAKTASRGRDRGE